jgi:NAD(P)-dependent dehydrogenase (short-subunit alcohol dehydrogenase family)
MPPTPSPLYALIAGVGPGTGRSCALRFARTYPVILLARRTESLTPVVEEIRASGGRAVGIAADVSDASSLDAAIKAATTTGDEHDGSAVPKGARLAAAVYNVGSPFSMKPFLELTEHDFESGMGSARGFFNFAQQTLPLLLETATLTASSLLPPPPPPTLILTGATASLKGSPRLATFAAGKFAQRAMCQSLAREFGPRGVHVVHAIIDGIIDTPATAGMTVNGGVEDGRLNPDDIAETYWNMHTQPRSTFTHEIDIRPYVEKF